MQDTSRWQTIHDALPAIVFVALICCLCGLRIWSIVRRRRRMRAFAEGNGLQYEPSDLPYDFPLDSLDDIGRWRSTRDLVWGRTGDDTLLTLALHQGWSRRGYWRTVVARRSNARRPLPKLSREYGFVEQGPWRIVWSNGRGPFSSLLLTPDEIERLWELLG